MPRRMASAGLRSRARARRRPDLAAGRLRAPNSDMKSSRWPCPARPPMPEDLAAPQRRTRCRPARRASQIARPRAPSLAVGRRRRRSGYIRSIVRPVMSVTASLSSSRSRVATCSPLRKMVMRSARRCDLAPAVRGEDDARAAVAQAGARARTATPPRCSASAEVGSSRRRMRGSRRNARTISTICRCASESDAGELRAGRCRCTPKRAKHLGRACETSWRRWIRPRAAARLVAEEQVLGDRHPRQQRQLLEDRADAEPRGRRAGPESVTSCAVDRGPCRTSGRMHAADDLDQRALAGAVLADERVHLAEARAERRVGERLDAAERAGDAGRLDRRARVGWLACLSRSSRSIASASGDGVARRSPRRRRHQPSGTTTAGGP